MTTKMTAKDIVARQLAAWNRHDVKEILGGYAEGAHAADPAYPEPLANRAAIGKDAEDFFTAFPDIRLAVTLVLSDGDTIGWEGSASGTHTGPFALPTGVVPATNKRIEFTIAGFYRVDDNGAIQDERRYYDVAGVLTQLGLMQ